MSKIHAIQVHGYGDANQLRLEEISQPEPQAGAEYCLVPAQTLAAKPTSLSFDQAVTVPIGAITAWQALFDAGQIQAGQRVLILGGSGGVGLFAVQFAHRKDAQVMTTTSTSNVAFLK